MRETSLIFVHLCRKIFKNHAFAKISVAKTFKFLSLFAKISVAKNNVAIINVFRVSWITLTVGLFNINHKNGPNLFVD